MLDLPKILKQAEAATGGDARGWFWNGYDAIWAGKGDDSERIASVSHLEYDDEGDEIYGHGDEIFGPRRAESRANAEFIATARTNVPLLVAALEEAQEGLKRYGTHLRRCHYSGAEPSDCNCGLDAILGESQ